MILRQRVCRPKDKRESAGGHLGEGCVARGMETPDAVQFSERRWKAWEDQEREASRD